MTKRTKLLSLMVAMVMCFACGIMMMSSSAKAEVEVPTAGYSEMRTDLDWSTGKNFNSVAFCVADGVTADWLVLEYYVPAGATQPGATSITFGLVTDGNYGSYERIDIKDEADGKMAKVKYEVAADSAYVANATDADVKATLAMDLANGKVYGSIADAAFEEIAVFENFAYVSSSEKLIPYISFGGNPSIKRLNNVKVYTEDAEITNYKANNPGNVHHGASAFLADKINALNFPATAVKPEVAGDSYVMSGSYNFINANPTTAEWIIYEYTVPAGNTYSNAQNGICSILSNDGFLGAEVGKQDATRSSYLHAFASTVTPAGFVEKAFIASAETVVKIAVNTKTGTLGFYRNGNWTTYKNLYSGAAGISGENRYYGFISNGASVNGLVKNVVCYDSNGVDLGVKSTLTKVADPKLPATAVKPEVDNKYYANDGIRIQNATATTAEHIIIEYTLKAGMGPTTAGNVPQNGIITTLSTDGEYIHDDSKEGVADGMLYGYGTNPTVHVPYGWFTAEGGDTTVKLVINTKTGSIFVSKNDGPYAEYAIHTNANTLTSEERYFNISTNAPVDLGLTGWVEDLVCYDSNGENLGVTTNTKFGQVTEGKVVDILDNLGCNNVSGGRYIGSVYFKDLEGNDIEVSMSGAIPALKYGTEEVTLKFDAASATDKSSILFSPLNNGMVEGNSGEDWQWEEVFVNQWYIVKAGTVIGGKVQLAEDMVIRMHGSSMQIFNATSVSFNIAYEGVGEAENPNATSYSFASAVTLADIQKENAIFLGWYIGEEKVEEISFADFYGDVTVTAKWQTIKLVKYNVEISYNDVYVNFYATFDNVDAEDLTATINGAEAEIAFDEARNAYAFSAKIALEAIANDVEIEILLSGVKFANAAVDVNAYLLAIANGEGEFAALAADLLALAAAKFDVVVGEGEGVDLDGVEASEVVLPEVGSGEIGLRDEANKWAEVTAKYEEGKMFVALAFETEVEGTIKIVANGLEEEIAVVDGKAEISMPLVLVGANAKLVFKAYNGEVQIGNDLVVNMAGFIAGLDVSDAVEAYLVRTVALYNTLAAYLAD